MVVFLSLQMMQKLAVSANLKYNMQNLIVT